MRMVFPETEHTATVSRSMVRRELFGMPDALDRYRVVSVGAAGAEREVWMRLAATWSWELLAMPPG
jgi:hypothetical protein